MFWVIFLEKFRKGSQTFRWHCIYACVCSCMQLYVQEWRLENAVPLLKEAYEGCNTRPWSYHHHGNCRVRRQVEGVVETRTNVDLREVNILMTVSFALFQKTAHGNTQHRNLKEYELWYFFIPKVSTQWCTVTKNHKNIKEEINTGWNDAATMKQSYFYHTVMLFIFL